MAGDDFVVRDVAHCVGGTLLIHNLEGPLSLREQLVRWL